MSQNEAEEPKPDISDLQENFSKQQKKISALKELVRKSEVAHDKSTSSAHEKVKNIAQRLTHLKSKARSRHSLDAPQQEVQTETSAVMTSAISTEHLSLPSPQAQLLSTPTSSMFTTPNPTPLKRNQRSDSNTSLSVMPSGHTSFTTPGSEKIQLLRQQMEQNKLRMAQRASSKQHLEQLVTQLKEKFDTTQQCLDDTSEIGRSMSDLSALVYTPVSRERHKSATDLASQPFNLERERIKFLENRCRLLEKQLEKEKQANSSRDTSLNESSVSQGTTKRVKELENKVLELEEMLRERQTESSKDKELETVIDRMKDEILEKEAVISTLQAKCLGSNEVAAFEVDELTTENERLKAELAEKDKRISELEEVNDVLESTRCDLTMKNNEFEEKLREMQESLDLADEKLAETKQRLEECEAKCFELQDTLEKLQNTTEAVVVVERPKDTDSQIKAEMAKQIQEQQDELLQLRENNANLEQRLADNEKIEVSDATIADKMSSLEATIESQREDLQSRLEKCNKYEEELMEKTIELNVLNANFKVLEEKLQATNRNKPLFSSTAEESESNPELLAEVQQLKQKLDESNKAMIKLKLKCKQTEKQMEKLKKTTDLHGEVVRLEKEKENLQQKIIELEDEKGQWQLQQVGSDGENASESESTQAQKNDSAVIELEEKCKVQTETIRLLEEQKFEYAEKLETTTTELEELRKQFSKLDREETDRVVSEMSEIQLEEQLAEQTKSLTILQTQLAEKDTRIEELSHKLEDTLMEKQTLDKKLEHYLTENMELLEKVDKLSKSSSSAESIEIVERLTQRERAEIDEFNKRLEHEQRVEKSDASDQQQGNQKAEICKSPSAENQELVDSLAKLREESSELMNKIELFTTERREVLEKMEHLTAENHELLQKIEELNEEKEQLETNALLSENAKSQLEVKLKDLVKEKELLANQVAESSAQKAKLSQELTSLQHSSEVVAALEGADGSTLFDKCEKSLCKLNSELEAYRKANDKNAKFNASKKLAKEAKNAYTQLSELLQKVKEASTAVETVTVVETVVAVTAPNGKALAEYEQLTAQNRELKATVEELRRELQESREEDRESTVRITEIPAITQDSEQDMKAQREEFELKINEYESQCTELQSTVEDLRMQLQAVRLGSEEKTEEITRLNDELNTMRKMSEDFDRLINDKEMTHEKQVEQLTRLRRELEAKCETYEGEMEILQTLITEQKQQIIEAYKESEHEINLKLLDLQQRDEEIVQLRTELKELKKASSAVGEEFAANLQKECDKLREAMKINKTLVAEQVDELANKQETIDTLNQQLIDLYKTMEENANKIIEKEDELTYLQELLETNTKQMDSLRKDNDEQKAVVDKLLFEIHSHQTNAQQLPQLESEVKRLEQLAKELEHSNKTLEQRNKDQLEKLKKYAANLKKRATLCQEYEAKIKELEKGALESIHTKDNMEANDKELHEYLTKNIELTEKVNVLEYKLKEYEMECNELREVIKAKTVEQLESMERNSQLETEMKTMQGSLDEKMQEVVQLQNALAASQDRISDWDDAIVDNTNVEALTKQLADQTECLERANQTLNEVQSELLQMQEKEKSRCESEQELQHELEQKTKVINELQQQLVLSSIDQVSVESLQHQLKEQEQRLQQASEDLKAKSLKFEKSKAVIKERNNQIHRLQAELKDLHEKLSAQPEEEFAVSTQAQLGAAPAVPAPSHVSSEEHDSLKQAYDKLNEDYQAEKSNFQKTIERLETLHDGIQAKLQEDMAFIETLEQENTKYKDKICKLEECVATFEERRESMERQANLLDAQLHARADEYEKCEDVLVYRMNRLAEHHDVIGQRLLQTQQEKEDLQERAEKLQNDFNTLTNKNSQLEKEYKTFREETTFSMESENMTLRDKLTAVEKEMTQMRSSYDAQLAVKTTELDEMECEMSEQLSQMRDDKRSLTEDLERARDECTELKDELVRLKDSLNTLEQSRNELERESTWLRMQNENSQQDQYELQELRMQTMQDKTEIDNLRHQIETLASNHEIELQGLRTQISELDTLRMQVGQNQTDDQVFIETENKRLTDLLAEKEALIENYQRQNLQLQMAAVAASSSTQQAQPDPFAMAFGLPPTPQVATSPEDHERLERDLAEKVELITRLQRDYNNLQTEFHSVVEGNNEMKRQLAEKQREIDGIRMNYQRPPPASAAPTQSHQSNDVIPAPMFFATEQMMPSPFDDIVQARTMEPLEGAGAASRGGLQQHEHQLSLTTEQPTIEDLQRNVSDLEKHAQDLENKLMMRNQRDGELEERLREMQERMRDAENRALERDEQLHRIILERQQTEEQHKLQEAQTKNATDERLMELQQKLETAEQQIQERETQLKHMEEQRVVAQTVEEVNDDTQRAADKRLLQLQSDLEYMQKLLQERDEQLQHLQRLADESHLKASAKSIEDQIIAPPTKIEEALAAAGPTLDMFFGASSGAEFESLIIPQVSSEPVVEELIVPKKAYDCHPRDSKPAEAQAEAVTALDLGDDWGDSWGGNEAAAEAEHFAVTSSAAPQSLVSREQQLEIQLQEQNERIQELQMAQERCEQQKLELQVKSGKLMKKLKEYKVKIDEASRRHSSSVESNSMFNDLDAAIQDELKLQIKQMEVKLEEQRKQHDQQNLEKEKLLKRIDVLTAGNERMSEMKERQDMDVQMYQARIRELQDKLNRLEEWGGVDSNDGTDAAVVEPVVVAKLESTPSQHHPGQTHATQHGDFDALRQQLEQKISELTAEIQDINGDRQELQALLEDEKSNATRAEETARTLQSHIAVLENAAAAGENAEKSRYNELKLEFQNLQEKCHDLHEENATLSQELQKIRSETESKSQDILQLKSELESLSQRNQELQLQSQQSTFSNEMEMRLGELQTQNEQLQHTLQTTEQQLNETQMQLLELRTRQEQLTQENQELRVAQETSTTNAVASELEQQINILTSEKQQLLESRQALEQQVGSLQVEISTLRSNAALALPTSGDSSSNVDELVVQLQEKESEIVHLKQRIEDLMREDQTEKLVLEILTKNQEIHMLKIQVRNLEEDKHELEHNLSLQITKEIHESKVETENETTKQQLEKLQALEKRVFELEDEKKHMEAELEVLNNHVMSSLELEDKMKSTVLELDRKNIEIAELKKSVETLQQTNANNTPNPTPEVDFVTLNAQWEAHVEQKCGEIAQMWRDHLDQREKDFKASEAKLQEEIVALRAAAAAIPPQSQQSQPQHGVSAETTATSSASESTSESASSSVAPSKDGTPLRRTHIINEESEAEADAIIEKMQAALESQEMEIVTLKEQLAIRSAEYARLAAQYDPFKLQTTLSHSGMNTVSGPSSLDSPPARRHASTGDSSVVPKSELDLALYMLHQRDMRCEEMTLELVSLLEERDTLQLKLSNTLRQVEAIKAQTNYVEPPGAHGAEVATSSSTDSPVKAPAVAGTTAGDSSDELNQKLSQLQTVNHSKDKIIKEERDQRIRQMEKIQQDVAKMPSEALSELVGSDLSHTSQSPSTVLLNWLWGNKSNSGGAAPSS